MTVAAATRPLLVARQATFARFHARTPERLQGRLPSARGQTFLAAEPAMRSFSDYRRVSECTGAPPKRRMAQPVNSRGTL